MRHAVAAQPVGDDLPRPVREAGQQALEEALGSRGIPPILDQDVEHDAMLIDRAPEVVQDAIDPQLNLIKVPDIARLWPAPPQLPGKVPAEPQTPMSVLPSCWSERRV